MVQAVKGGKISRAAWYALTLVALTNVVSLLDRNIIAILAPRIKQSLAVGDAEMALLYGTVFALFYALFSLPLGRLADGWSRTRLLGIALGFWSLATGLAAFAHGFTLLAVSRLGVGIGEGAAQPAGNSLLYDYFPKRTRGFVMAVVAAAIAAGLGGSLALGGFAADWWDALHARSPAPFGFKGWQFAFLLASLPGLPLAMLLGRMAEPARGRMDGIESIRDPHPFRASLALLGSVTPVANWFLLAKRRAGMREWCWNLFALGAIVAVMALLTRVTSALSPRPPLHLGALLVDPHALQWGVIGFGAFSVLNLLQSLRLSDPPAYAVMTGSPSLLLCMAIGALQMMINYGVMGFTPSFIMKHYGASPSATGLEFGAVSATIGIVGPLIAGPLSDRINVRFPGAGRVYVCLFALALSPLLGIWTYSAEDSGSFYLRFIAYGLILTGWLPPLYAVLLEQVLPRMRGIAFSTYIVIYTIFGLGIGPFVVGMISDANGGNLARAILDINWIAPVIIVLLLILARRANRDENLILERARGAGEII
jgi:MFS family permease